MISSKEGVWKELDREKKSVFVRDVPLTLFLLTRVHNYIWSKLGSVMLEKNLRLIFSYMCLSAVAGSDEGAISDMELL